MCSKNDVSDCILLNNGLERNLKPDVSNFFFLKWLFKEAGAVASVARPAEAGVLSTPRIICSYLKNFFGILGVRGDQYRIFQARKFF